MTESEKNAEIVRLRERCALLESLLGEGIRNHYFNEAVCFSVMAFGSEPRGGHVLRRIVPSLLRGTGGNERSTSKKEINGRPSNSPKWRRRHQVRTPSSGHLSG